MSGCLLVLVDPGSEVGNIGVHVGVGGVQARGGAPGDNTDLDTVLGEWSTGVTVTGALSGAVSTDHTIRDRIRAPAFLTIGPT